MFVVCRVCQILMLTDSTGMGHCNLRRLEEIGLGLSALLCSLRSAFRERCREPQPHPLRGMRAASRGHVNVWPRDLNRALSAVLPHRVAGLEGDEDGPLSRWSPHHLSNPNNAHLPHTGHILTGSLIP